MEIEVGGRRIHVGTSGECGPAVVLVHASGMAGRQFRALIEQLARDHRVFAPDLVGYGRNEVWQEDPLRSGSDRGGFDPREDEDIVCAVAAVAGPEVSLVGHSYGGWLALRAAARVHPRALVLFEPVAFGVLHTPPDPALADLAALDAAGDFFSPTLIGTAPWCERFVDWWGGVGTWARMGPVMQGMFVQRAVKTFHEVYAVSSDRTPLAAYPRGPRALLLHGSETRRAAARVATLLAEHLGGRLEVFAGAGHMAPLTHADEFATRVAAFLRAA
ncbi:MAG: alpha/beta hydrolase [Myxococcales bacterium]|nr:alpha/beta hydrolase [Myxococcales bacterium]